MYGRPIPKGLVFRQLFVAPMAARQAVKGRGHVDGVEALSLLPDDLQQGLRALVGGPGDLAVQPGHGTPLERLGSILGSWIWRSLDLICGMGEWQHMENTERCVKVERFRCRTCHYVTTYHWCKAVSSSACPHLKLEFELGSRQQQADSSHSIQISIRCSEQPGWGYHRLDM